MGKESENLKNAEISEESVENVGKDQSEIIASEQKKKEKQRVIRLLVTLVASAVSILFFFVTCRLFYGMVGMVTFALIAATITLAIVSIFKGWEGPFKLSATVLYIVAVCLVALFIMMRSGVFQHIDSTSDLIRYINNSGGVAELVFVLLNFLQVTIVPIPSSITTTAGAILFKGIWKPLYLTVIGLVTGSMFAFFLGRVFGVRFANWLVGEKTITRYREMTKGKDKIVLFYMFLFPFFPDDFLCILAGMTSYTYLGFFLLQIFSRTVGTLTSILLTKGIVSIPLHGWWLLLWAFIILVVIFFLIMTIKYSDKLERLTMKLIDKLTFGYTAKLRVAKENKQAADEGETPAENAEIAELPRKGDENDTVQH